MRLSITSYTVRRERQLFGETSRNPVVRKKYVLSCRSYKVLKMLEMSHRKQEKY